MGLSAKLAAASSAPAQSVTPSRPPSLFTQSAGAPASSHVYAQNAHVAVPPRQSPPPVQGGGYAPHVAVQPPHNGSGQNGVTAATSVPTLAAITGSILDTVRARLHATVEMNQLQDFYPPQRIEFVAHNVVRRVDFQAVSRAWGIPFEVATDLASLALYDIMIYADDSSSMRGPRWDVELRNIFNKVVGVAGSFDDTGLDIRFMNSNEEGNGITPQNLISYLNRVSPSGMTPMGTNLNKKILNPIRQALHARKLDKPVLVMTLTDGAPTNEPEGMSKSVIANMLDELKSQRLSEFTVAYGFSLIGTDGGAKAFLDTLDDDDDIGEVVDVTSSFEAEAEQYKQKHDITLTREMYLLKLLLGPIDPDYDEQDETKKPRRRRLARPAGAPAAPQPQWGASQPSAPGWNQPQGGQSQPACGWPQNGQPSQGQPPGVQPNWSQPQSAQPGWGQPQVQQPGWGQPQAQQPDWGQPHVQQPGWGQPQGGQPGFGASPQGFPQRR